MPKLSIITINLNNSAGLQKTIESVIGQTYKDYEYLLVDGGSTDGSFEFMKNQNRLTKWISEPDKGIYNAMNKGIDMANGDYLLFLNSGDVLIDENVLAKLFSTNVSEDIVYGDCRMILNEQEIVCKYPDEHKLSFRFLLKQSLSHPSMLFKKELFKKHGGYNEDLIYAGDWEFYLLAIFKYNASLKKVDIVISRFDSTGISSDVQNQDRINAEREKILHTQFRHFLDDYKELERLDRSTIMKLYRSVKKLLYPVNLFAGK